MDGAASIAPFSGSIDILEQRKEDPENMRAKVTSKGGTTQAAMEVFMKNKFEETIKEAVLAAKKKAGELSKS